MLRKLLFILILFVNLINNKPNLFLGAGGVGYGCGSNSPAVQRPFSYVRLGPDTTPLIKKQYFDPHHYGGYSTRDIGVRAFSHMHLVGAGVIDLGIFGILPIKKQKVQAPNDPLVPFYKQTENAVPGYYNVTLQHNISVELTTTQRAGVHRYCFNSKGNHQIYIMSSFLLQKKAQRESLTQKCGQNCVSGQIFNQGGFAKRFGGLMLYYHLEWVSKNQKNQTVTLYDDKGINSTTQLVSGNHSGAIIHTDAEEVEIYVGVSYVSRVNAKDNLLKQVNKRSFDQVKTESLKVWQQELQRFQITAVTEDHQIKIDTAIYRTLLTPTMFNDFNGDYLSFKLDKSINKVPNDMKGVYTDMSLWDVHRSQFPWLQFQDLQRFNDIAKSIILINREGGYMPKWPFANGHTGCMIGSHANTVLADWIIKQTFNDPSINKQQIFSYMLRNANTKTSFDQRSTIDSYISTGYLNVQTSGNRSSCPQTLEYSYNDFGIGKVAQLLGKKDVSKQFQRRSKFYKNVWNSQTKFFQPRLKNGSFVKISAKERINIFSNHYVEGDAWHYRFFAPHDPQGLIELFGGKDKFVSQLEKFFKLSFFWPTLWLPNPYYWAGNQHDLFSVWLFNFANRTDLSQKYSRMILNTQYGLEGDGLPGNDDYGTMSAWLVFASLGFYPLPSQDFYMLGSPAIHSARIYRKMGNGKILALNINVKGNSAKHFKVEQTRINGKFIQKTINHQDFTIQNSVLDFEMKK